jgi:hypothetical protein
MIHDLLPNAAVFGVLVDTAFPSTQAMIIDLQAAAHTPN